MRSFAEDLRNRSDGELARLLDARPDLARPQPADLTALAGRASTQASTSRAIDHLDAERLTMLTAIVSAGSSDPEELAPILGIETSRAAELIDDLVALALLWRAPDGLAATRTAAEILAPEVGRLGGGGPPGGRYAESLGSLIERARTVGDEERAVLVRLAWSGAPAALPTDPDSRAGRAVHGLIAQGLLQEAGEGVRLPPGLALAVRMTEATRIEAASQSAAGGEHVDRVAAGAIVELLADVDEVLRHVDRLRPRVLRSGGLAVRDNQEVARSVGVDPDRAALLLEMAREADLVADDRATTPAWRLTTVSESWAEAPDAERWAALASAWMRSLRAPSIPRDGAAQVFAAESAWPPIRSLRRDLLLAAAQTPPGAADTANLVRRLRSTRPRRLPDRAHQVVDGLRHEFDVLGLLALGGVSTPGAALASGSGELDMDRAAAAAHQLLPAPVDEALLQADLTAVVPGVPTAELGALLRSCAALESRGGGTVFRFSEASIRGALDAGMTADTLLARLAAISATGVPQPLEYLVRDVARRHGHLLVGGVSSYLRSDDPGHLESLLRHRDLGHLQLRQIAPSVLVSPTSAAVVLDTLREIGAAPALEGSGGVVSSAPPVRRIPPPRHREVREVEPEAAERVVARLRAADAREIEPVTGPRIPPLDPASSAALLREAAADRVPVWVGVSDSVGATSRLLFLPTSIDGGRVRGEIDGRAHVLSLHRITGVGSSQP